MEQQKGDECGEITPARGKDTERRNSACDVNKAEATKRNEMKEQNHNSSDDSSHTV